MKFDPTLYVITDSTYHTTETLLHAVEEAGRLQKHETGAVRPPENEYVQHSLEVMELLMGLVPVGTGSAQQQFGRLHVGSQDCWILLGSQPDGQPGPGLSSDYAALESFFAELTDLLLRWQWWDLAPETLVDVLPVLCDPDLEKVKQFIQAQLES